MGFGFVGFRFKFEGVGLGVWGARFWVQEFGMKVWGSEIQRVGVEGSKLRDWPVFKVHRLLYHSTLGSRVMKKNKQKDWGFTAATIAMSTTVSPRISCTVVDKFHPDEHL